MKAHRIFQLLSLLIYVLLFIFLAHIPRIAFAEMIIVYTALFALYAFGWYKNVAFSIPALVIIILAVRLPFFFNLPWLSDDFFRFLWDGLLITEGLIPYGVAPSAVDTATFANPQFAETLLSGMNSPEFASVYPPINQLFFTVASFLSGNNLLQGVNVLRLLILFSEGGLFLYFLFRFRQKIWLIAAYLLNPLVVAEGIGNVHFEAAMIPWLAVGFAEFGAKNFAKAGIAWSGSILIKLTPLMLAPVFWFQAKGRDRWVFALVAAVLILALTIPWFLVSGLGEGLGLYFHHFEFNASVYYLVGWIGSQWKGYNVIATIGPGLGLLAFVLIVFISWKGRRILPEETALLVYLVFYLLSTTVHPWYGIIVVYLAIMSNRPLILVWSFTIWFSYSHYSDPFGPKWLWLVAEYIPLFLAIILENRRRKWFQSTAGRALLRG